MASHAAVETFPVYLSWDSHPGTSAVSLRLVAGNKEMPLDTEELFRRYGPMVLRRCRWMLHDDDLASDALQEVFLKILRNGAAMPDFPAAYLYRAATNVCLNLLRTRHRHPETPSEELLQRIADSEDHGERLSAQSVLDRLFRREQESTRTIAVLHLLDGFTLQEVAGLVGLSVSGVRKRLRTLKERVKELEDI